MLQHAPLAKTTSATGTMWNHGYTVSGLHMAYLITDSHNRRTEFMPKHHALGGGRNEDWTSHVFV